ncbi:MAG: hypothetical protein GWO24_18300 [Akkermansiaceae bacterium]|nr:hypothetical protein [Akkermansiaceae bacterium]
MFLGLTGEGTVRFSDDFHSGRRIEAPGQPFVLAASSGEAGAVILHNGRVLAHRATPLSRRELGTRYVIGQQGNIDGEYWDGEVAELLVYDRQLSEGELAVVGKTLATKYGIPFGSEAGPGLPRSPELLALASVCHVLLNSNEFLYVD